MVEAYNLYIDDSGTRHPDKKQGRVPKHGHDWFALGGILLDQSEEEDIRALHQEFCTKWNIEAPLRSANIRATSEAFSFIRLLPKEKHNLFYEELYQLMKNINVLGFGCVIDRPGYMKRYDDIYGNNKWLLCKTAFSVVIERASKHAIKNGKKLRVFVEEGDKSADKRIVEYYNDLKTKGLPFKQETSSRYSPINNTNFKETLYDLKFKKKSSKIMQLADLYLWPICMGGYDKENRPYKRLLEDSKLIDSVLNDDEKRQIGIKYSCWDIP